MGRRNGAGRERGHKTKRGNEVNSDTLQLWPLLILIEPDYVPNSARLVLEVAHEYDEDKIISVQWALAACDAEEDAKGRLN